MHSSKGVSYLNRLTPKICVPTTPPSPPRQRTASALYLSSWDNGHGNRFKINTCRLNQECADSALLLTCPTDARMTDGSRYATCAARSHMVSYPAPLPTPKYYQCELHTYQANVPAPPCLFGTTGDSTGGRRKYFSGRYKRELFCIWGGFSTALHARLFTRAVRFNQRTLGFYLDGFSGNGRIS